MVFQLVSIFLNRTCRSDKRQISSAQDTLNSKSERTVRGSTSGRHLSPIIKSHSLKSTEREHMSAKGQVQISAESAARPQKLQSADVIKEAVPLNSATSEV